MNGLQPTPSINRESVSQLLIVSGFVPDNYSSTSSEVDSLRDRLQTTKRSRNQSMYFKKQCAHACASTSAAMTSLPFLILDSLNSTSISCYIHTTNSSNPTLNITTMLNKYILGVSAITLTVLTPIAAAGGPPSKYDPYNSCGAPFCGSTGNVAAAGAVVRDETAKIAIDEVGEKVQKAE